jgi:hypothetical protein
MLISSHNPISGTIQSLIFIITMLLPFKSHATELLFFFDPHCGACIKFEKEIVSIYHNTQEAEIAPLVHIQFYKSNGELSEATHMAGLATPVTVVPSFVLMHEGHETDRIIGYGSDELFWMALNRILENL